MPRLAHKRALALLATATLAASGTIAPAARADQTDNSLTLSLRSDLMNGAGAQVEVRVNGSVAANLQVDSTSFQDYSVALSQPLAQGDMVDVRFCNDQFGGGQDRNLYVRDLSSAGTDVVPTGQNSQIDLGATWSKASDGHNVIAGGSALYSDGSLRITWPSGSSQATTATAGRALSGAAAVSSAISLDSKDVLVNQTLPGRQVWGHFIGYGLPDWDQLDGAQYGDSYFLDLVHGGRGTASRSTAGVARAQAAGFTGMQILQQAGGSGYDFIGTWMQQADPTWSDSDPDNDFSVAPVMAEPTTADFVRMVSNYVQRAKGHPSAAKVDGKYVIYAYGSRYRMSAADWAAARAQLDAQGVPVFVIADLCEDVVWHNWQIPTADIKPYLPSWDATWAFETDTTSLWSQFADFYNNGGGQFAGGISAGYNAERAGAAGALVDPQGTAKLRGEWETSIAGGLHWQNLITYNDLSEDTEIEATSNWSSTRADINAFYSAKFRGVAYPRSTAELYVTTPKAIRLGEPVKAEGMVLNPTGDAVRVTTQLVDGSGAALGQPVSETVAAGSSGDATTPSVPVTTKPAGGFFRAVATSYDAQGRQLQTVTSAPVLVYAADATPTDNLRRTYYSIPARLSLPGTVTLKLSGNPAQGGASAAVSGPVDSYRFLEVLQNTRLVRRGYDTSSMTTGVPMENGNTIVGGEVINSSASGFYVGRLTDAQEHVGYSDPVYVP